MGYNFIGEVEMVVDAIPTPRHNRSVDMYAIFDERDRLQQMKNLERIRNTIFNNYQSECLNLFELSSWIIIKIIL